MPEQEDKKQEEPRPRPPEDVMIRYRGFNKPRTDYEVAFECQAIKLVVAQLTARMEQFMFDLHTQCLNRAKMRLVTLKQEANKLYEEKRT